MTDSDVPASAATTGVAEIRTFLDADIRGYTLFTQERGDEAAAKLAERFADIAGEVVDARGGTLLELRGDEALCVFASARDAIRAATDLQRRFVEETIATPELPLTVGIGLDAGESVRVGDGYRGGALNLAARLCGHARAGEILASREVTHLARAVDGIRYEDRGEMRFKNLSEPVSVVRVLAIDGDPVQDLRPFIARPPSPSSRPRKVIGVVAGVVAIALVAITIPLLTGDDSPSSVKANSFVRLDPGDGTVAAEFDLDLQPGAMAIGYESAWIVDPEHDRVVRIRLGDGSVADTIPVGHSPSGIAVGDGAVWVANAGDGSVERIDVATNEVSQTLRAGSSPQAIAIGGGSLWVADHVGAALLRIDPDSGHSTSIELDGLPSAVAFTPAGVWVTLAPGGIARVDDDRVTLDADVGRGPSAVTYAFGSIWVANDLSSTITRIDPSNGEPLATIPVEEGPSSFAQAADQLWVSSAPSGSVAAIDPSTDTLTTTVPVEGRDMSLAGDGGDVWLGVGPSAAEHQGGTLHVWAGDMRVPSVDPSTFEDPVGGELFSMTNDGLVAYRKVGGPDGLTVVPDLANAPPEISENGLAYRFAVRDDVAYSDGTPVRPEDFRRALERSIALSSDGIALYGAIIGAERCGDAGERCDLSRGIEVDEGAVTFHLAQPDGDFLFKLALPYAFAVPADTPIADQGLDALPATGPYVITEASEHGIRLERNPAFRQWSSAAQPVGFADEVAFEFGVRHDAFEHVASGDLDVMLAPTDPEDLAVASAQFPGRIFEATVGQALFIAFDVKQAPFNDVRVRRALSYALDRAHLVEILGGERTQRVTCQILPPNIQGYTPYCPYTRDPRSGAWSAPDVDRARELVEQAGAVGETVTVSIANDYYHDDHNGAVAVSRDVTATLDRIGLRAKLQILSNGEYIRRSFYVPSGSPQHPQVFSYRWYSGHPGASQFLYQFRCGDGFNVTGYCDPTLDHQMVRALSLQTSDPGSATRAWSDIEHELVDEAVVVPIANPILTSVVSERAGNVQINPQIGVLLSQIWVT